MRKDPAEYLKSIIAKNTEAAERDYERIKSEIVRRKVVLGKTPINTFLTPLFVKSKQNTFLTTVSTKMFLILNKIIDLYFTEDSIAGEFILNSTEKKLIEIEPGYKNQCTIMRVDAFLEPKNSNSLRILECNTDSPGGMSKVDEINKLFLESRTIKKFCSMYKIEEPIVSKQVLLEALLTCYKEFVKNRKIVETKKIKKYKPVIAIVDLPTTKNIEEFMKIKRYFESWGVKTIVGFPENLKYDGKNLYLKNLKIDLVYKRVIVKELIESTTKIKGLNDLIVAYRAGDVCLINSLRVSLLNKHVFSCLSDGRFDEYLTKEEIKLVKSVVPWTRNLIAGETVVPDGERRDMEKFLQSDKDLLVIKPSGDYGGKNVYIGRQVAEEKWLELLERAFKEKNWVVQKFINIPKYEFPIFSTRSNLKFEKMYVNVSPYVFNGKYASSLVRVSREKVINVSRGGGIVPLFVVKRLSK